MAVSNSFFQFKQFLIYQDACAMKVTTDACILGASAKVGKEAKRVLDIGTGTGLLALMLAQAAPEILIDAIELDADAARQAKENIARSPWPERIAVINGDVRTYCPPFQYDMIISNPPFFKDSLLSGLPVKDTARHTICLSFQELLQCIAALLSDGGYWWVILPTEGFSILLHMAVTSGWHLRKQLNIKHTATSQAKRIVGQFSANTGANIEYHELVIKCHDNQYTPEFVSLLQPYYLHL